MSFVLKSVGFIGVMFLSAILNGWALSILWGWFIVPVFGLPGLGIVQALGVALVISYLTTQTDTKRGEDDDVFRAIVAAFVKPCFALIFGYIVTLFIL